MSSGCPEGHTTIGGVRSYRQYCALARALDLVGDRWSLLIVRELMIRDACRYTDLLNGLPGIATNLLADRLRWLERVGVLEREDAPPPVATTLFRLTPRGRELEPVLFELIRWGGELMIPGPVEGDAFLSHWLIPPVRVYLADQDPDGPRVAIELRADDLDPLTIEAERGRLTTRPGAAEDPDMTLTGTAHIILGVLSGMLDLDTAQSLGLRCDGDPQTLARVQRGADGSRAAPTSPGGC